MTASSQRYIGNTKYRIDSRFGIAPETGFPTLDYMVQKRVFLRWREVQLFTTYADAEKYLDDLAAGE